MRLLFIVVENDEGVRVRQKIAEFNGNVEDARAKLRYEDTKFHAPARRGRKEENLEWFPDFKGKVVEVYELVADEKTGVFNRVEL